MRRVVVTGLGAVTPLGPSVEESWSALIAGRSGAGPIVSFDPSELPVNVACHVTRGKGAFEPERYMDSRDRGRFGDFVLYAAAAADMALRDADFSVTDEATARRSGIVVGTGIGALPAIEEALVALNAHGPSRIRPYALPGNLINTASGYISLRHGLKGPNGAVSTACASGSHAIREAASLIMSDDCDVMVAGGTEAPVCRVGVACFAACRALSTNFNDAPQRASRPYDRDRDGFVIGEGAGIVILEEYGRAVRRGAKIYGELIGYGMSGDAYHVTAPPLDGEGAFYAMEAALRRAGIGVEDVDYVNAHGTSTPRGDDAELAAVDRLFGEAARDLSMSSTKSATGHLLGASGAVEAVFSLLAIRDGVLPPTLNLDNPPPDVKIDLVPHEARKKPIDVVLSNGFAFGGTNISLVFGRVS